MAAKPKKTAKPAARKSPAVPAVAAPPPALADVRAKIDEIDRSIQALIAERAQFAHQVGKAKGKLAAAVDYYRPEREAQVLRRLLNEATQLRLTPTNIAQYSALLPGNLKSLFPGEHLILRSIANQQRVAMVLVADQAELKNAA